MCPGDPMLMASFAVNRTTPSGRVAGPEQRIDVASALRAVTIGAAHSWRREDELGSIEVGKIANLTVLDRDPFEVDPSTIGKIPIRTTMFEGRVFDIPHSLVEQRCTGSAIDSFSSSLAGTPVCDAGCGCEVAAFLARHVSSDGWAA